MELSTEDKVRKVRWRGEVYDLPTLEELEQWSDEGGCETPDGDWVEPDHPHSWLRLLGFI